MLSISGNDNLNNIGENSEVLRTGLGLYKSNPMKEKSTDFIDQTDISSTAMQLYEREQDIQKFTKLALTDVTNEEKDVMLDSLFTIASQMRDDELANSLLDDERFIRAMFQ